MAGQSWTPRSQASRPFTLAIICQQAVQLVLGCSSAGFGARRGDVALGADHGFAAEELHQGVDADLGVGEFGGKGVAQPVHEGATCEVGVDAGTAKSAQHPVLQGTAGDPLTIRTDE